MEELQKIYDIPIIGIINPTVTYVTEKGFKDIGVIATRGTIRSNSWEKKIKEQNPQINVYNQECPLLAPMAEEGWTENQIAELVIKEYLKEFHGKKMDALILGCTHYPLYENIIKQELPNVEIINTGTRIVEFIENSDFFEKQNLGEVEKDEIYLTDTECNFLNVARNILKQDVEIRSINKN